MKKRTIKLMLTLLFLALTFIPWNAFAAEETPLPGEGTKAAEIDKATVDEDKPELSADAAFLSQYIWRGYAFSKDSLVIQPSITAAFKGFALNLWGNLDTNYDDTGSKWNETDMTFSYGHSFGIVGLEAGYIYYALDGVDDSKEFYLSAGVDVLLAPTLTVYREIASYKGWYINLGLSHSFELPYDMSLDLGATFAYFKSDNDNGVDYTDDNVATSERYSGLHDGLLSVGLAIPFYKYFTITPSIAWAFPLSDSASNEMSGVSMDGRSNHVFGGVTLSMAF